MFGRDVVNKFLNEHGFAHSGTSKQSRFAPFQKGTDQIDNFDACFKNLRFCGLFRKHGRRRVDGCALHALRIVHLVDRVSGNVKHASKRFLPHGNADGLSRVCDFRAARETVCRVHRDGAHNVPADVLCDFKHKRPPFALHFKRRVHSGKLPRLKGHVDNRPNNLCNSSVHRIG